MPKLIEIKDGAEYTVNEYSVWLEVSIDAEDEDRKVLIHPSAFDSLTKAMAKANEIAGLDGDKATKEWDKFVLLQECKGARFGRTSIYATEQAGDYL
jgi:hypothetical protein